MVHNNIFYFPYYVVCISNTITVFSCRLTKYFDIFHTISWHIFECEITALIVFYFTIRHRTIALKSNSDQKQTSKSVFDDARPWASSKGCEGDTYIRLIFITDIWVQQRYILLGILYFNVLFEIKLTIYM